jgi:hypothetical protein
VTASAGGVSVTATPMRATLVISLSSPMPMPSTSCEASEPGTPWSMSVTAAVGTKQAMSKAPGSVALGLAMKRTVLTSTGLPTRSIGPWSSIASRGTAGLKAQTLSPSGSAGAAATSDFTASMAEGSQPQLTASSTVLSSPAGTWLISIESRGSSLRAASSISCSWSSACSTAWPHSKLSDASCAGARRTSAWVRTVSQNPAACSWFMASPLAAAKDRGARRSIRPALKPATGHGPLKFFLRSGAPTWAAYRPAPRRRARAGCRRAGQSAHPAPRLTRPSACAGPLWRAGQGPGAPSPTPRTMTLSWNSSGLKTF